MSASFIRKRTRSRAFRSLETKRIRELVAGGMPKNVAQKFARQEIQARARISLVHPESEALAANLVLDDTDDRLKFRFVYPPIR